LVRNVCVDKKKKKKKNQNQQMAKDFLHKKFLRPCGTPQRENVSYPTNVQYIICRYN